MKIDNNRIVGYYHHATTSTSTSTSTSGVRSGGPVSSSSQQAENSGNTLRIDNNRIVGYYHHPTSSTSLPTSTSTSTSGAGTGRPVSSTQQGENNRRTLHREEDKDEEEKEERTPTTTKTTSFCLPSLLDTPTEVVESTISSSQVTQQKQRKRQNNTRQQQQQRCATTVLVDVMKRLIVYAIALTAITSSVLSIFSCNFFSYTDITVSTDDDGSIEDGFTIALDNVNYDGGSTLIDLGYQYTPFDFLNEAGVGLFAYYMGDPSEEGSILYKQEPMCFLYCDDLHDFYWFSNNYNPNNQGLLTRKIDLWIIARYCAILAPIVALLGLLQLIVVENWCCGYRINIMTHTATVASSLVLFVIFLSASMLQLGTFSILFASPNLSSPSQSDGTTYQESFCFSTTTTSVTNYSCRLDAGGFYSLGSGLVYLVLAVYSSLSTYGTTTTTPPSSDTSVCCGGCCLHRGDRESDRESGTHHHRARKGGIISANNNHSEKNGDTSDSSSSSSNSDGTTNAAQDRYTFQG